MSYNLKHRTSLLKTLSRGMRAPALHSMAVSRSLHLSALRPIARLAPRQIPCMQVAQMHQYNQSQDNRELKNAHQPDCEAYESNWEHADHFGRQQNHIWSKQEIDDRLNSLYRHKPVTVWDKIMNTAMYGLYHTFNALTGYKEGASSVTSIEWRLIVLESFAGVPGFVAAGFRHFHSLRALERDHGWIMTLLEEAENERMHLLVCLQMFNASFFTRTLVITAQMTMTPVLMVLYTFNPSAMHRFVGYLEETACHTYASIVKQVETPGTELHDAWFHLPAPEIAVSYWRLPHDATFGDTLRCMFADETHHRDVNHTFAEMDLSDPSPFALQHKKNAIRAFEMHSTGERAWAEKYTLDTPTDDLPKSNVEVVVA